MVPFGSRSVFRVAALLLSSLRAFENLCSTRHPRSRVTERGAVLIAEAVAQAMAQRDLSAGVQMDNTHVAVEEKHCNDMPLPLHRNSRGGCDNKQAS